jgi:hypothetical protein
MCNFFLALLLKGWGNLLALGKESWEDLNVKLVLEDPP